MVSKLLYVSFWLLSLLPLRILYVVSDIAYFIVRYVAKYRRRVVRENLRTAFPEKSEHALKDIECGFYHYFCDQFVETIKSISMSRQQMMKRMQFTGLDEACQLLDEKHKFMFIMLGHYGNWEWIASLQYWLPKIHCSQIYHRLRQAAWDELFLRIRSRYGGESFKMQDTLRRLVELRSDPRYTVVGFIADQQPHWNSIHYFLPFLNHETAVYTGAEHISKRIGSIMMYGRVTRIKRGYYRCDLIPISERPETVQDFELTNQYFRLLEEDIQQKPEIWLWSHKRWTRTKEKWLQRQAVAK